MNSFYIIFIFFALNFQNFTSSTPLDDYVNQYDPNYGFKVVNYTYKGPGFTLYCLNMTSQKWLTDNDTVKPIWYHAINIAIPDEIKIKDTGFLYIAGGGNDQNYLPDPNDDFNSFITTMAATTGTISAVIHNIPNQPTVFLNDPSKQQRYEDEIIAWTWRMFLTEKSDQPEWLARLPMTKAVVRGFDAITTFSVKFGAKLSKFMICGESKRGWTTWTTAAVDKRVIAMAPIVMDLLNLMKNLEHHYQSLGGWTCEFADYWVNNITYYFDNPLIQKLADIVDPYSYKERYTIPKYIVTTSNDEFFLPDDSHYYFNDLPNDKYLRILANAEHSLKNHRISLFLGMRAFYLSVLYNYSRPIFTWERNSTSTGGSITLYTKSAIPIEVNAYSAITMDNIRRDYRAVVQDPNKPPGQEKLRPIPYAKTNVRNPKPGIYVAEFTNPPDGLWKCFFIQMTFQGPEDSTFEFTTEAHIIPETFPFPPCKGDGCYGTLV